MQNKQQKTNIQNNKEVFNIQVLSKYLTYWPLFLFFLLISIGGAYSYLHFAIPKYGADATLIIKDEKKGSADSRGVESMDPINSKKIIENEVEVLQSRSLMNNVVKKLHLYAPISVEGKFKSISAYHLSPILIEVRNPDSIRESKDTKRIDFEYNEAKGTVLLNKSFSAVLNTWTNTPYGILKFIKNDRYVPSQVSRPYFFSLITPKNMSAEILSSLKVTPSSKLSSVIDLSYKDEVPRRAEDILNELISSYGNAALDEKNTLARNTLAFIEERLRVVKRDLDSIERNLKQYKSGSGAVDISRQGQIYLDNVSNNDKKLTDISIQISALDQIKKHATTPGSIGMIPSTLGINDPSLNSQMTSLSALELKYNQLKETVGENSPILLSIVNQINQLKPSIISNIESQRQNLEESKNNLSASGGVFHGMISSIPEKERQLVEITRDQSIKNGTYSFLLQKREESELSLASSISDSKVVNFAQSTRNPVSPNRMMIYMMALVFGVGFPIAFIAAREAFSPKILYRHEIESLTNIPIVGEIAFNKSKNGMVLQSGERTLMAEEFRKVRVSLLSLGIDAHHKKILITSSIAGEGKSFIAANLATSISLTGKKVVLVELDLHDPGLGKFFGIKDKHGVTDYLTGKKEPKQIIYQIPGNDNLFYISAGTMQKDPSELLENGKVKTLMTQLDADFDVVIIDTAPIVLITDAYLLSSLCDTTLYVIMHKITPKILVKRIDDNIAINPIKNPAIIFNGVKTRGFFKNNYGYGYNYAYGYDNKNKKKKKSSDKNFTSSNGI